mmetsp:Transcript_2557/g.5085  ORF Transcript_2557/g.5085 Transcript_2557/m.5085 type:complete len:876 (-) Transcript_2557:133-2760(-)|eukprot:CAMPEP_0182559510 /NCGR_PEP_ID=MMETSP1324-20130603/2603_1 /TAXON_ID=236786 /ORGANISM="Florenciella sp., Strain RCC1587" /LENGTH=875 /DNA_ID=CAMNT_0024771775 /DNA_START=305 /DNA_END=2932 /DNA_ORIENTATION=+
MGGAASFNNPDKKRVLPWLQNCPLAVLMDKPTLEEFAGCFTVIKIPENSSVKQQLLSGTHGDFFIVGEGQIDVSVKVPSTNKKTGFVREVLTSKREGDMLWVPAVEQFAERMAEAHEGLENGALKDAKARKPSLKAEIPQSSTSGKLESKGLGGLVVGGLRRMSLMGASPKRIDNVPFVPAFSSPTEDSAEGSATSVATNSSTSHAVAEEPEDDESESDVVNGGGGGVKSVGLGVLGEAKGFQPLPVLGSPASLGAVNKPPSPTFGGQGGPLGAIPGSPEVGARKNGSGLAPLAPLGTVKSNSGSPGGGSQNARKMSVYSMLQSSSNIDPGSKIGSTGKFGGSRSTLGEAALSQAGAAEASFQRQARRTTAIEKREEQIAKMKKQTKIRKQFDMTTVSAPFGAKLLQLDKEKFGEFERKLKAGKGHNKKGQPVDFSLIRVMMKSNIQDYIKRIPFLVRVPTSRLEMLGEMSNFEIVEEGTTVCEEGTSGDKLYVVVFGSVSVHATGDHEIGGKKPEQKFLAELGMGDHFGELSVIADVPRQATVRTTSACLLVSISRAPFRNLMKVVPDVGTTVQSVMKLYMLSKFFRSLLYSEALTNINAETIEMGLLPWVQLVETEAGQLLLHEREQAEDFYFLYHGKVVAKAMKDGSQEQVGELGPGSYFGEISILTNTPCRASLFTLTRTMMLKVTKADFLKRFCQVPGFRSEFLIRILGSQCKLENVLEHDIARRVFEQHLSLELASENIHFYDRSQSYLERYDSRTDAANFSEAQSLYRTYMASDAPEQVNIPQTMLHTCRNIVLAEDRQAHAVAPDFRFPPRDLFGPATSEALKLMEKDNFRRFVKAPAFVQLLKDLRAYEGIDISNIADDLKGGGAT